MPKGCLKKASPGLRPSNVSQLSFGGSASEAAIFVDHKYSRITSTAKRAVLLLRQLATAALPIYQNCFPATGKRTSPTIAVYL
jgi:hypothetical protein